MPVWGHRAPVWLAPRYMLLPVQGRRHGQRKDQEVPMRKGATELWVGRRRGATVLSKMQRTWHDKYAKREMPLHRSRRPVLCPHGRSGRNALLPLQNGGHGQRCRPTLSLRPSHPLLWVHGRTAGYALRALQDRRHAGRTQPTLCLRPHPAPFRSTGRGCYPLPGVQGTGYGQRHNPRVRE